MAPKAHLQLHPPPHGRKASAALARPSKTRSSLNSATLSSATARLGSGPGWSRGAGAVPSTTATDVDDECGGMESFLQFCTTCERQIVTPGGSILYCSEACRRKDVSPSPPLLASPDLHLHRHHPQQQPQPSLPPYHHQHHHPHHDHLDLHAPSKPIVQPRSPTVLRPLSGHADLSPPVAPLTSADAEAAYFLTSRFPCDPWVGSVGADRYPLEHRDSTASIPSLSHTPSSSVGTFSSLPFRTSHHTSTTSVSSSTSTAHQHPSTRAVLHSTSPTHLMSDGPSSLKSRPSICTSMRVAAADHHVSDERGHDRRHSTPSTQRRISQAQGSLRQLCEPAVSRASAAKPPSDEKSGKAGTASESSPSKKACSRGKAALYFI